MYSKEDESIDTLPLTTIPAKCNEHMATPSNDFSHANITVISKDVTLPNMAPLCYDVTQTNISSILSNDVIPMNIKSLPNGIEKTIDLNSSELSASKVNTSKVNTSEVNTGELPLLRDVSHRDIRSDANDDTQMNAVSKSVHENNTSYEWIQTALDNSKRSGEGQYDHCIDETYEEIDTADDTYDQINEVLTSNDPEVTSGNVNNASIVKPRSESSSSDDERTNASDDNLASTSRVILSSCQLQAPALPNRQVTPIKLPCHKEQSPAENTVRAFDVCTVTSLVQFNDYRKVICIIQAWFIIRRTHSHKASIIQGSLITKVFFCLSTVIFYKTGSIMQNIFM